MSMLSQVPQLVVMVYLSQLTIQLLVEQLTSFVELTTYVQQQLYHGMTFLPLLTLLHKLVEQIHNLYFYSLVKGESYGSLFHCQEKFIELSYLKKNF